MKPSWNDAPEWANWLAMDENGEWYWYENEPNVTVFGYWDAIDGICVEVNPTNWWKESLEQRK